MTTYWQTRTKDNHDAFVLYVHLVESCMFHLVFLNFSELFVAVNFDILAQASDFRIERGPVVFPSWMQDSNPEGVWNRISSRLNARWHTDWAIEEQAKKYWTRQPVPMISEHSAHSILLPSIIRTSLWRYTGLLLLISILLHRQVNLKSPGLLPHDYLIIVSWLDLWSFMIVYICFCELYLWRQIFIYHSLGNRILVKSVNPTRFF